MKCFVFFALAVTFLTGLSTAQKVVQAGLVKDPKLAWTASGKDSVSIDQILTYQATNWNINMTVGTPPQSFTIVLDTGSAGLWMPNLSAPICHANPGSSCNASQLGQPGYYGGFEPSKSSSLTVLSNLTGFSTGYADGTKITGTWGIDSVSIGDLKIENVQFGIAENGSSNLPLQPIYGIGLETLETDNVQGNGSHYPSPVRRMKEQGLINCQLFSLYPNGINGHGGSLTFGGVDTAKFTGKLNTMPILSVLGNTTPPNSFIVPWTSMEVGNYDNGKSQTIPIDNAAILDTGATQMFFPADLASKFDSDPLDPFNNGGGELLCSANPKGLYFRFGFNNDPSATFTMNASDVVQPSRYLNGSQRMDKHGKPLCSNPFMFTDLENTNLGVLGSSFLSNVYSVFDVDNLQIGLAQLKYNVSESNFVECQKGASQIPSAAVPSPTASFTPITALGGTTTGTTSSGSSATASGKAAASLRFGSDWNRLPLAATFIVMPLGAFGFLQDVFLA